MGISPDLSSRSPDAGTSTSVQSPVHGRNQLPLPPNPVPVWRCNLLHQWEPVISGAALRTVATATMPWQACYAQSGEDNAASKTWALQLAQEQQMLLVQFPK